MFASDWLKGRHKIDALLDPFQHSRGHYPLITEGNWATYLSFEVELCSSLYPPIGYWKRNYQTILLITIAKPSWLQLYNWVDMMICRNNFACLNLQQNLLIWSLVFKGHVTTVSLLQEFSLDLKWHRYLCKKLILWNICEDHFITHYILNINPFIEKKKYLTTFSEHTYTWGWHCCRHWPCTWNRFSLLFCCTLFTHRRMITDN